MTVSSTRQQLELLGLDECLRRAETEGATQTERLRLRDRYEVAHGIMSALPEPDELAFLHSGLCQTYLPHSRPKSNRAIWRRSAGDLTLIVQPGVIDATPMGQRGRQPTPEEEEAMFLGVPWGAKARLILIYLQSEGLKGRVVQMGPSLSAWVRSMGLPATSGPRGSLRMIRDQTLRIARCQFTFQWEGRTDAQGNRRRSLVDVKIANRLDEWLHRGGGDGDIVVELTADFHDHLKEHAVPLDRRAIAMLAENCLGLDLYALFAHRMHRISPGRPLTLTWRALQAQLGTNESMTNSLAKRIREVLPDVLAAYPDARVEATRRGLVLTHSLPPVPPRTSVLLGAACSGGLTLLPGGA
jgi:Plasmid encoded RepA protein